MRLTMKIRNYWLHSSKAAMCLLLTAVLLLLSPLAARAQQEEEQKGVDQGNYNIKQSIEFGGRFTNLSGDFQAYDTFVNLQQGPRLLGFTTEMRSLNHHGTLQTRTDSENWVRWGRLGQLNLSL